MKEAVFDISHFVDADDRDFDSYHAASIGKALLGAVLDDGYTVVEAWQDSTKVAERWRARGITVHEMPRR